MSNLIVMAFESEGGAAATLKEVESLQKEHLIQVEDAATAVRGQGGKVKVKQVASLAGAGALGGAFWGMLFGLLFFVPFLGMAVGAAAGALFGKAADIGINDDFIRKVSQSVQPGNSALFLLVSEAKVDRVIEQLKPYGGKIIATSLGKEEEVQLREAFAA
ncbi:MAG TPA: DUF1269 domain-containing protein [Candidatus Saccharimonadales bacterium]|nr:DUF1269 domain-containing protein [Candidatus Saccharimonadales bacterium]